MIGSSVKIKQEARSIILSRGITFLLTITAYLIINYLLSYFIEMISGYYNFLVSYYEAVESGADILGSLDWPTVTPVALLLSGAIYLMIVMLSAGYQYYLLSVSRGAGVSVKDFFESFNHTGKVLVIVVLRTLAIGIGTIAFVVPGIIMSYKYRAAMYVMYDNPELSPIACLKESSRIMNGHKKEMLMLDLSFIGWIIASDLVAMTLLPLLEIFVSPYTGLAAAIFYRDLTAPELPAEGSQVLDPETHDE